MKSLNDKISLRQFQILLILDLLGTGVITLPRYAAYYAAQDAWIVVLISTLFAVISVFAMTSASRRLKGLTFTEYTCKVLSKPIGIAVSLLLVIRLVLNSALQLRLFGSIVKEIMLSLTPLYVVSIAMLAVCAYGAAKGIETISRVSELLILIIFIPLVLVFAAASKDVDYTNILPVFVTSPDMLLKGGFMNLMSFTGIEICMLIPVYLNKPDKIRPAGINAVIITGILMTVTTLMTVCKFGYEDVQSQIWPVLNFMGSISLPGSFIERQDAIVMSFWIVSVFAIVNAGFFFSSVVLKDVIKKGKHIYYILALIPIVFIASYLPDDVAEIFDYMWSLHLTLGVFFMLILPVLLWVTAWIRRLDK